MGVAPPGSGPVFIVGNPRSGSTLLASLLDRHDVFACGPETHFFNQLDDADFRRSLRNWPEAATEAICSLTVHDVPVHESFQIERDDIIEFLGARAPSTRAMLESLTATYAIRHGARRWVEKTPNHISQLARLRAIFPEATIIETARHPVASAHGMRALPWASPSAVANSYLISDWASKSDAFLRSDVDVVTVRHEDLLADPVGTMTHLFGRLGECFEPGVLTRSGSTGLIESMATWKEASTGPLDSSMGRRWERDADESQCAAISAICADYRHRLGYDPIGDHRPACVSVRGFDALAAQRFGSGLDELAAQGMVIVPAESSSPLVLVVPPSRPPTQGFRWRARELWRSVRRGHRLRVLTDAGPKRWPHRILVRLGLVIDVQVSDLVVGHQSEPVSAG